MLCSVGETDNRPLEGFSAVPVVAADGTKENPSLGSCYARGSVPAATSAPSPSLSPTPASAMDTTPPSPPTASAMDTSSGKSNRKS